MLFLLRVFDRYPFDQYYGPQYIAVFSVDQIPWSIHCDFHVKAMNSRDREFTLKPPFLKTDVSLETDTKSNDFITCNFSAFVRETSLELQIYVRSNSDFLCIMLSSNLQVVSVSVLWLNAFIIITIKVDLF